MDELLEKDFWSGFSETWRYPARLRIWRSQNVEHWSLLLSVRGEGRILSASGELQLNAHDVALISPGLPHQFVAGENWELLWIHFVMPLQVRNALSWPELLPSMRKALLSPTVYSKVRMAMQEAHQLNVGRPKGWFHYAVALIGATVLRIDNAISCFDCDTTSWLSTASELLGAVPCMNVDQIAASCGVSRTLFFKEFRRLTGYSPAQYRDNIRLRNAEQILVGTDQSIAQIAETSGFGSVYYFSLRFKMRYGVSPRQYRLQRKTRRVAQ